MAAKPVVCPECGAAVPYGRLSCAACGTLLASVAGGRGRNRPNNGSTVAATSNSSPTGVDPSSTDLPVDAAPAAVETPDPMDGADDGTAASGIRSRVGRAAQGRGGGRRSNKAVEVAEPSLNGHPAPEPSIGLPSAPAVPPAPEPIVVGAAASAAPTFDEANPPPNTVAALRRPLPPLPPVLRDYRGPVASVAAPRPLDEDDLPLAAARPSGDHDRGLNGLDPADAERAIPGAYLAPSASHSLALHGAGTPRPFSAATSERDPGTRAELTDRFAAFVAENSIAHEAPAPAPEPAPVEVPKRSRFFGRGSSPAPTPTPTPAATPAAAMPATPGPALVGTGVAAADSRTWFSSPIAPAPAEPRRQLITFRAPAELAGWAVAVGGFLAALSFALPWAKNGVAGGGLDRSYFGQWGLANPAYLLLVVFSLIAMLLAIVPNRLPRQLVDVAVPFVLGGFLCGLGWSYATGPFGTGLGVDMMFGGAVLLVVGGSLGLRPKRATADSGNSATTP